MGEAGKNILIIPKLENQQGCKNIDEIVAECDGIMVARGDMGIEIPAEKVFIAQKQMISKCNKAGKPIICATQMLESMVKKPRPTRAEASDVANAILDGADCVMLSGETAKGDYPLHCIRTMAAISREAEACFHNEKYFEDLLAATRHEDFSKPSAVAISGVEASFRVKASAIIALTTSGSTAKLASKYRPRCPIIAVSKDAQAARQLHLNRAVMPLHYTSDDNSIDARVQFGIDFGKKSGFIKDGDLVVSLSAWKEGSGSCDTVRILKA